MGGLNVSNVQNFMSQTSIPNEPASSFAPGSCQAASAHTTKPASGRADFFRSVRDKLPPNAATPLPFTMELLASPDYCVGQPGLPRDDVHIGDRSWSLLHQRNPPRTSSTATSSSPSTSGFTERSRWTRLPAATLRRNRIACGGAGSPGAPARRIPGG